MNKLLPQINTPEDVKKLPMDKLPALAAEIREYIKEVVAVNGGHLGSNLGAVEFTIALNYVFNFRTDRIIWDVSHQCYTHKILTERREYFKTLRQYKGLSGFTSKDESPYDPFTMGHAGTSVSTALGILCGDKLLGTNRHVIAVVGDGAMTCGATYEALNNSGALKKNLIVILNDNTMSISRTVGAMADYLSKVRIMPLYQDVKKDVQQILDRLPLIGQPMEKAIDHLRASIKATIGGYFFEALGFHYYGPFDGHNIENLVKVFNDIKKLDGPVIIHLVTEKGKGYELAEKDPFKLHGISPKPPEPKVISTGVKSNTTYTDVFARAIIKLAQKNEKIVAITAAMPDGTGLVKFEKEFPNRFFDVGICEQHAVGLAAGLAYSGLRPVAAIYSTFLQRALDQVFQEACLQDLPIVFAMDRAGLVGNDGPTHHGVFDIAYLRAFPNMVLMSPKDGTELAKMLEFAVEFNHPCAIRYPRTNVPEEDLFPQNSGALRYGKAEVLMEGKAGAIIAYGTTAYAAYAAAKALRDYGVELTVVNARFAKPLDTELFAVLFDEQPFILTVEEHAVTGGFGSAVLELAANMKISLNKFYSIGIPDRFIVHGDRNILLDQLDLSADGIFRYIYKKILQNAKGVNALRRE